MNIQSKFEAIKNLRDAKLKALPARTKLRNHIFLNDTDIGLMAATRNAWDNYLEVLRAYPDLKTLNPWHTRNQNPPNTPSQLSDQAVEKVMKNLTVTANGAA